MKEPESVFEKFVKQGIERVSMIMDGTINSNKAQQAEVSLNLNDAGSSMVLD
jgi:hypothetical protein